jgi:hypothetical protein
LTLRATTAVVSGTGCAVATVAVLAFLEDPAETALMAVVVGMIFGAYAGFAVGHATVITGAAEFGFIGFGVGAAAAASVGAGRGWLVAALVGHGIWDLLHHPSRHVVGTGGVPASYVEFCATYDLLVAAAIAYV